MEGGAEMKESCLDSSLKQCDENSNYYCLTKDECNKGDDGKYTCSVTKCGDEGYPSKSMCTSNDDCKFGNGTCNPLSNFVKVGTCSKNQPLTTSDGPNCCGADNIGEDTDGTAYCCGNHEGVSMKKFKQCTSMIQDGNKPCCINGLCDNGYQCKVDAAGSTCVSKDLPKQQFSCCDSLDQEYTVNDIPLCCPNKVTDNKCLNLTAGPIDPDWVTAETKCKSSDTSCIASLQTSINNAMEGKLTFNPKDNKKANYGQIFCSDDGKTGCILGCGYREDVSQNLEGSPMTVINITDSNGNVTKSRCIPKIDKLQITTPTLSDQSNTTPPSLLCKSSHNSNSPYYWTKNGIGNPLSNSPSNATMIYNLQHSDDPSLCPYALSIGAASQYSGTTLDKNGNSITISSNNFNKTSGVKEKCTAIIDCEYASSAYKNSNNPNGVLIWQDGTKTFTKDQLAIIADNTNMRYRISKQLDKDKICSNFTVEKDCNQAGSNPQPLEDKHTISPCYWQKRGDNQNCKAKTDSSPGELIPPITINNKSITCPKGENCSPLLLADGTFCPNGTENGTKCE
jgi:hypothetical protein